MELSLVEAILTMCISEKNVKDINQIHIYPLDNFDRPVKSEPLVNLTAG